MYASWTTAPRLERDAVQVRRFSSETSLLITSEGDHLLVAAPATRLAAILESCDGTRSFSQLAGAAAEPSFTLMLLQALVDAGCLNTIDVEVDACLESPR